MIACLLISGFELRAALRSRPRLAVVPAALAPGTYYVGVIADSGGVITEPAEQNNIARLGTVDVVP